MHAIVVAVPLYPKPMYRPRRRQSASDRGERRSPSIWDSTEAWAACAKALREYDEDMIQDWKEEIDTLLVFAGLFSAVLTAFNIESYKLLQQQDSEVHTAILSHISSQLNGFTVNANLINTTAPEVKTFTTPFRPSGFAVRLNILWFSSLVCSLLSASLGLLVKQWLREYLAGSSNISRESIRIRQYRYEGLRRWHVPEIILCLPILLQLSLLLFFIGLLDLLWTLHPVVAAVMTTIVAVSMLFAFITSILPPLYPDCPYKSPQSWLICAFIQWVKRTAAALASHYHARLYQPAHLTDRERAQGAATPDPYASKLDLPALIPSRVGDAVLACLHYISLARTYASWKEREKFETETGRTAAALDDATIAGADATFMDDAFLHTVLRPCMRDIAPRAALRCVDSILLRRAPRVLNDMPYWDLAHSLDGGHGDTGTLTLMNLLLDVLHRLNASIDSNVVLEWEEEDSAETKDDARRRVLMTMHRLVRAIPAPAKGKAEINDAENNGTNARTRPLFRRMFAVLAGVLVAEVKRPNPERFVMERSFKLMHKLFARFQAVGPDCIVAFCAYSKQMRLENKPYSFVHACCIVIRASAVLARAASNSGSGVVPEPSTSSTLLSPSSAGSLRSSHKRSFDKSFASATTLYSEPLQFPSPSEESEDGVGTETDDADSADDYTTVRPALLTVLHDLECFLSMPVSRAADCRPTMAMLSECAQAVLALAAQDRLAVTRDLVQALSDMAGHVFTADARARVCVDGGDVSGDWEDIDINVGYDTGGEMEDHETQMTRQAVRWLRRMYGLRVRAGLGMTPGRKARYSGYDTR